MRLIVALCALMAISLAPTPLRADDGGTLLTITGYISKTNRGPFDAFHDGFLNYHGKTFEKAFEFDAAALAALPQQVVRVKAEPWPRRVEMSGPLLADVLAAAGAEGKPLLAYALDGYGAAMTPEQVAERRWVLASHADGKPLGIGGRGPLWLVYDTGDGTASVEEEAAWVWSVFHIAVGD